MSSRRRHEHESSSRREGYKLWSPAESDSDHRPRQTMTTSQRPNVDQPAPAVPEKHQRSRRVDGPADLPTSASYTHHRAGSKEQANPAVLSSSYYTVTQAQAQLLQNTVPLADTSHPASGSSRPRTKEPSKESHSLRTYLKRKTEKRSSPSSDEKILVEHARSTRSGKQPRDAYQSGDANVHAPSTTHTYWIPPDQNTKEASSSKPQRDRDKETERERRHAEKARLREEERTRRKADERAKARDEERARERAAEAERDRRREKDSERDRRRHEKERERERSSRQRDRDKAREHESRRRDPRYTDYANGHSQAHAIASQPRWANTDDRISTRQVYPDQIPSSSPNVVLTSTQYNPAAPTPLRPYVSSADPPRGNPPDSVPDKKHHRSHRDKTLQYGTQESGLSSSEQESGRERTTRVIDRKRTTGNATDGLSGPSGSETERTGKRKHRTQEPEPYTQAKGGVIQKSPAAAPSAASLAQTAFVGSNPTPYKPQIVSIRAGQGPSDQQVPLVPPKTPAPDASSGRLYGAQQEIGARLPQGSYLQVPPEVYGSARAANSFSLQNGYIHSQSGQPQTSAATYASLQSVTSPYTGQQHSEPVARAPVLAPIPPVKQSASTLAPSNGSPLPPLPAKSHTAPSPRRQIQSLPVLPKGDTLLALPHRVDNLQVPPVAPATGGATFAKLSVYQAPDVLVSGELTFSPIIAHSTQHAAESQGNHPQTSGLNPQDSPSRFPLNEEELNSAPTRTTQTVMPPTSGRSATFPPPANSNYAMHTYATPPSPMQSSHRPYPQPGDDTPRAAPIPIPEPRSMTAFAQAQAQAAALASTPGMTSQSYDPRSPKHALVPPAPILSSSPFHSTRPHASPLQSAPATMTQFNVPPVTSAPEISSGADHSPARSTHPTVVPSIPMTNNASHSPSRSTQINISRSSPAAAVSTLTPKQSPSGRMHLRNGSSDTISQAAAKNSPSSNRERNLAQRTSVSNLQSPYATSRQDTTTAYLRQPPTAMANAGYPESNRYRTTTLPQSSYPVQHAPVSIPAPQHQSANTMATGYPSSRSTPQVAPTSHSAPQSDPSYHKNQPAAVLPATFVAQPISSASAIAAAYRNGTYHEITSRPPDPTIPSRVPQRSAPSPAPTGAGRQYPSMSSTTKTAYGVGSIASPQPTRGQTFPVPGNGRAATVAPTMSHVRSASDSQFGITQHTKLPVSGQLSTPAPSKHGLEALRISSSPTEPEQLRTPSSLAPSMSRHNSFAPSIVPSITPSKEKERKKGFFGLFRSRSSPPKQMEVKPPSTSAPKPSGNSQSRPRANSQNTVQAVATSVKNIIAPHPTLVHAPTSIVAPTPMIPLNSVDPNGDRKSPGSKMFTSFRLISKRHRTISAASVEAMDGTAPNTVIGGESVRSSTAGRPSPPLRDPAIATFDWRNREEAGQTAKGTRRRHRPGVTFDFEEDVIDETSTVARPARRSSRRYETR